MNKNITLLIFWIFTILSFMFFYYTGGFVNYATHLEIKQNIVNHPEFIPKANLVKASSSGFDNLVSDFYWLDSIQYIGSNAVSSEYKKYLYQMLNLITDLNPHFSYPYQIGELLLSSNNERYENLSEKDIKINTQKSLDLGLKGIKNLCDSNKLEKIKKEYDLKNLWTLTKYEDPCLDPQVPYYLAYIYYWNLFDGAKASEYYRITSANKDAPTGSRIMAAIMQGKSGDREKSILMFLSLAESLGTKKTKVCSDFANQLGGMLFDGFKTGKIFDENFIFNIEKVRQEIDKKLGDNSKPGDISNEYSCSNYLNKAVREINLAFLEKADEKYKKEKGTNAKNAQVLFDEKFIKYIPVDFQQEKDYGIIYHYNKDTKHWDYKMGKYGEE